MIITILATATVALPGCTMQDIEEAQQAAAAKKARDTILEEFNKVNESLKHPDSPPAIRIDSLTYEIDSIKASIRQPK